MILPIVTEPNPILHQQAKKVEEITPELVGLIHDMRETMHNAKGVGLAAPQIGQAISVCVIELIDEDGTILIPFTALINPRITWKSKKLVKMDEACLSIPGVEGSVKRPDRIRVKAQNQVGANIEIEAEGFFARVLQHEIDHLNGVLFTSYVSKNGLKNRPLENYPQI